MRFCTPMHHWPGASSAVTSPTLAPLMPPRHGRLLRPSWRRGHIHRHHDDLERCVNHANSSLVLQPATTAAGPQVDCDRASDNLRYGYNSHSRNSQMDCFNPNALPRDNLVVRITQDDSSAIRSARESMKSLARTGSCRPKACTAKTGIVGNLRSGRSSTSRPSARSFATVT
jgi:hypothetical protein